ncbi:MAG: glycosyl hydrolase family protein, partial [Methanobacteriota archaeon]
MVRAKLPYGQGIWPAIWMLPTDYVYGGWPSSGEVDIMEMLGHQTSIIYGSLHFGSDSPYIHDFTTASTSLSGEDFSQDFHIFEINWFPTKIEWYVDGILYQTLTDWYTSKASFPAPFDQRFHLLLNIAVGGNWPGNPDNTTTFPQRMEVDFVRVYQDTNAIPTVTISSPQNGTVWTSGTQQKVTVQADGHQYGITTVALYQDEVKLGEVNEPPYEFILTDVQPGVYKLRAVATNTLGIDGVSDEYTVTVSGSSQFSPVTIAPQYIPGTLEIENYDMGGENVAYHDIDAVNNAKYNGTFFRTMEGVDVEKTLDPNGGEYNVGWLETGEWLNYSVKIQESADYDVV